MSLQSTRSRLQSLQIQLLRNWSSRIGIGLRSISQARVNCSEEDKKNYNVWQNWVISILKESEAERLKGAAGGGHQNQSFLRRPSSSSAEADKNRSLRQAARLSSSAEASRTKKANMFKKTPVDGKIIWVDCEMSGLNPVKDKILEIGMVITDENLNVIAEHDSVIFHVDEPVLEGMDAWCQKHHGESGLIDSCRKSTVTFEAADEALLKFVQQHTTPRECPMAGNSIGQDAGFIKFQLPKLYSHFHYRVIDVSSLKELVRRWDPKAYAGAPKKKFSHRVLDDIKESIEELKYYRSAVFRLPDQAAESLEQARE